MNKSFAVLLVALSTLALNAAPSVSGELQPQEQAIAAYIDAHSEEAIAFLAKAVNIDSRTENVAGVKKVGTLFTRDLDALGMHTRWITMPAEMKRAGHLVAETGGTQGKRVLMLGHLDTVLGGETFRREGNKAYGSGTNDMKGGAVLMLYALKALNAVGALDDRRITVLYTGDEEDAGLPIEQSRADMVALAKQHDLVLGFESTVNNTATVGRRGASKWLLEVQAKTGHSSGIFAADMGDGAIFETSRILQQFYATLNHEKYLTFNPAIIVGGTQAELNDFRGTAEGKDNVVPARVVVSGDLRFISEAQKQSARERMRKILAANLAGTSAHITFEDGYPAMTPTEGNYALLRELDQLSRDLGYGAVEALDPGDRGAGDIGFVAHLLPGLDGIGAGAGGNAHATGEWMELDTFPMLIKRTAVLLYRLTQ